MKLIISNISDFKWQFKNNNFNPDYTSERVMGKIKALFELLKNNYTNISGDKDTEYIFYIFVLLKANMKMMKHINIT